MELIDSLPILHSIDRTRNASSWRLGVQDCPSRFFLLFFFGKNDTLVLQFSFKRQVGPSIFKKINLVSQFLFLGQIYSYTDVMLYNTIKLILKSHLYPWLFSLLRNLHVLAVVQQVNQTCARYSYRM